MNDAVPELDAERLAWMYRQMLRIREFEERVKATFTEHPGVIRGHTHLADGAEASIVGSLAALRPGDQVMATYRCHGYPLVLGSDPNAMMAEIYGRATGLCGGYGGSMHRCPGSRSTAGTRFSYTGRWPTRWPGPAQGRVPRWWSRRSTG